MSNINKIILTLFLLSTVSFFGQKRPAKEKIKALKVAFMTERLELNNKEAQAFWPIYNQFEEAREKLRKKQKIEIKKMKDSSNLSEKDAKDFLATYIKMEYQEEALENNLLKDVGEVLSAKKAIRLLRAEEDFKRQLIKQYRNKH